MSGWPPTWGPGGQGAAQLLRPWIRSCHINRLADPRYPWRELFTLLRQAGYDRCGSRHPITLAEIQDSPDRERLLQYYRALWIELIK